MDIMYDILKRIDLLEVVIIRASALVGVLLFCSFVLWNQIKDFAKHKKRRRRKPRDTEEKDREDEG